MKMTIATSTFASLGLTATLQAYLRESMKRILQILIVCGAAVVLGTSTSSHASDLAANYSHNDSHETESAWRGKSGAKWHHRTDHLKRLTAFHREGSTGFEIEFFYEGDSSIPTAARLAGHQWRYKRSSVVFQIDGTHSCDDGKVSTGAAPHVSTVAVSKGWASQQAAFGATKKFSMRHAVVVDDETDPYREYWETYHDLSMFVNDWQTQLFNDFLNTTRTPEEREQCKDTCDNIFAWALVGCGAIGVEAPPVGVVCGAYETAVWQWCKSKCRN